MAKKPFLKNYCVLYSINTGFELNEDFFWRNRPNTSFLSEDEEKYEANAIEMYLNADEIETGIIQAYTITEAKIKMMYWIEKYKKEHNFENLLSEDEVKWMGFCNFNRVMYGYDYDEIVDEFKEYFDLTGLEILKDVLDLFYNLFYSENKEYKSIDDFDFNKNQNSDIIRKWKLFRESELEFFKVFNNRKYFELFYVEKLLKI